MAETANYRSASLIFLACVATVFFVNIILL